jgi:hypothetical protein
MITVRKTAGKEGGTSSPGASPAPRQARAHPNTCRKAVPGSDLRDEQVTPIVTLGEDETIGSVSCWPPAKEVRMAPMRVGLTRASLRQRSALAAIGVHRM